MSLESNLFLHSDRHSIIFDIRRNQWNKIKFLLWNVRSLGFIFLNHLFFFFSLRRNIFHLSLTLKKFHSLQKNKKKIKQIIKTFASPPPSSLIEDSFLSVIISCIWSTDWHISSDSLFCKWLVPGNEWKRVKKITECHVYLSLIHFKGFPLFAWAFETELQNITKTYLH